MLGIPLGLYSRVLAAQYANVSEFIHRSHNVTVLIYHLVFPAKYRRAVFDDDVDRVLKEVCLEIEKRYQVKFLERTMCILWCSLFRLTA